ncbi:MAG TPA: ABC transporter substrate-binding protein, partial [Chloroflexota bacterium]|nr:ABC transporter substrate-binding protein [Chloroflexota bacterium]
MLLNALLLSACGLRAAAPGADSQILSAKIAIIPASANGLWSYAASDLGIFQNHGVQAQLIAMQPPAAVAALASGELDFVTAIGSPTRAVEQQPTLMEFRIVFVAENHQLSAFVARADVTGVDQLRGRVVALAEPRSSVSEIGQAVLEKAGLARGQYQVLYAGQSNAIAAAITSGNAAAGMMDVADALKLERDGYRILDTALGIDFPNLGLGTTMTKIKQQPELVRRVVEAGLEAVKVTASDKERVVPVIVNQLKLPEDEAAALFDRS